jgi:ribosomal protein S18 acetylase RimI-like enzyme
VIVREALPGEMGAVGALRVEAYRAGGLLAESYAPTLRALGNDGHGTVLVAAEDGADAKLLGTVMLEPWHDHSEVARSPQEAEVRALAVAPRAQGLGVGRALMGEVISRATARGARRLLLSTQPAMTAAQGLYRSLGFRRLPELDWAPVPGITLIAFGLPLAGRDLPPP